MVENNIIHFAHLADLHLGAFRERVLTDLNFVTFQKAIARIIEKKVDFCLFSGDIFHTALPSLELVDNVVKELLRLKHAGIPLYVIGGSHDYTHTGKSYLHIFHTLGLFEDLSTYETVDQNTIKTRQVCDVKTKALITGVLGKTNGLDKVVYDKLSNEYGSAPLKIFMFHSGLEDFKPEFMKSVSIGVSSKDLPFGFDYYAGGHIHTHAVKSIENKVIVYPGCLFPNNFSELKREKSSMVFCSFDTSSRKCEIEREILDTFSKVHISVSVLKQTPIEVYNILLEAIENEEIKDKLILLELKGTLSGKISDIHIETILKLLYDKGAMFVLKNTHNLVTTTIESKLISELVSQDEIEKRLFEEYVGDSCSYSEIKELLDLSFTKQEGEKIYLYEERIKSVIQQYFKDKSFKS